MYLFVLSFTAHWLHKVPSGLLTYSMVRSPSWSANWFAASQEIPHISRNPKVHYRTHKRPPPVSILDQPNPVHIPTSHLLEFHPNIIRPSTPRSPQWSLSLPFPQHLLTYLLTPWCRVILEQLTGLQLVKKFPAFHGTRRFITALTSVRHLSLSWTSPIQSIYPHSTSWRSTLILSTHLRLGLPSGLFPSSFPSKTLYTPLSSPIRATWDKVFYRFKFLYRWNRVLLFTVFFFAIAVLFKIRGRKNTRRTDNFPLPISGLRSVVLWLLALCRADVSRQLKKLQLAGLVICCKPVNEIRLKNVEGFFFLRISKFCSD